MAPLSQLRWRRQYRVQLDLAASLQPVHRGEWYEDPLQSFLDTLAPGSRVVGGGSQLDEDFEVVACDIDLRLTVEPETTMPAIVAFLEEQFAPRGSYARWQNGSLRFGIAETLVARIRPTFEIDALYDDVPGNEQLITALIDLQESLRGDNGDAPIGAAQSWMIRERRTSVYCYGHSASDMRERAADVFGRTLPSHDIQFDIVR